jgi:hypothetical protein
MANRKSSNGAGGPEQGTVTPLARSSILDPEETLQALRELAEQGKRPLSWEIRQALEDHVERHYRRSAA